MGNWRETLRQIEPYVPGEQPNLPDMIKLNTNENPYPPSPRVREILRGANAESLRLYPDLKAAELREAIAQSVGTAAENVFVGVGSDDVLALCFLTFFHAKEPILFPDITYSFYDVWARLFCIPYVQVPLDANFKVQVSDYARANGGVVMANPNAPTGIAQSVEEIEKLVCLNRDTVVIIDEAYVDFGAKSAVFLTKKYDNVLVVQTCSKSRCLAGMRIGYAIGNTELIAALNAVRYSFNSYPMTVLSLKAGAAAMRDTAYFDETRKKVMATRERTKEELRKLKFTFFDSQANFIFARHERVPAEQIFARLKEEHIFVRHFSQERIRDYLRISIGTDEEMERFLAAVKKITGE